MDSIRRGDKVTVIIWGPENQCLYKMTGEGFHNIESAVNQAVEKAQLEISPEDCLFEVSNDDSGVTHKYRLNAHGNLKLII